MARLVAGEALVALVFIGALSAPAAAQPEGPWIGTDRSAENRLILDVGVTAGAVAAPLSGQPDSLGLVPADDDVRAHTGFVLGDVRLGTVGRSGVNTYAMATGAFNPDGQPDQVAREATANDAAMHRHPADPYGGAALFVHQAYGEIDGFTTAGAAARMHLRAGRHHHLGLRAITFDGATLGYRGEVVDVALRGGRRSGVFADLQRDPGLFGAASLRADLARNGGPPVLIRGEIMALTRQIDLDGPGDRRLGFGDTADVRAMIGDLGLDVDLSTDVLLSLSAEFAEAVPGHIRGRLLWSSAGGHALRVHLDQKIGADLPYDLAMGRGIRVRDQRTGLTRRSTHEVFRLNIPDRQAYTDVEAGFLAQLAPWLSVEPELMAHVVLADAEDRSAYDADQLGWGLVAAADTALTPLSGLEAELAYRGRQTTRTGDTVAGLVTDVGAGAEGQVHEAEVSLRYTRADQPSRLRRMLAGRWLTLEVGGFVRRTTLENRYLTADEQLVGGQLRARLKLANRWTLDGRYEAATASDVTLAELSTYHTARLRVGAAW